MKEAWLATSKTETEYMDIIEYHRIYNNQDDHGLSETFGKS